MTGRVLGVDPGITVTGYGVITGGRSPAVVSAGEIKPPPRLTMAEKLEAIFRETEGIIEKTSPDAVAVEGIFHAKNVKSVIKLGHARGVILLAAARAGIAVYEYSPREVKAAATGYGAAEKLQVEKMIKRILELPDDVGSHACDALAVALCHLHAFKVTSAGEGG